MIAPVDKQGEAFTLNDLIQGLSNALPPIPASVEAEARFIQEARELTGNYFAKNPGAEEEANYGMQIARILKNRELGTAIRTDNEAISSIRFVIGHARLMEERNRDKVLSTAEQALIERGILPPISAALSDQAFEIVEMDVDSQEKFRKLQALATSPANKSAYAPIPGEEEGNRFVWIDNSQNPPANGMLVIDLADDNRITISQTPGCTFWFFRQTDQGFDFLMRFDGQASISDHEANDPQTLAMGEILAANNSILVGKANSDDHEIQVTQNGGCPKTSNNVSSVQPTCKSCSISAYTVVGATQRTRE